MEPNKEISNPRTCQQRCELITNIKYINACSRSPLSALGVNTDLDYR